jgi:hypothetical protein
MNSSVIKCSHLIALQMNRGYEGTEKLSISLSPYATDRSTDTIRKTRSSVSCAWAPCYKTKRRGRVVSIPASYSGGPGIKSRLGDRLSWSTFFIIHPDKCRNSTLNYSTADSFHILSNSLITLSFDCIDSCMSFLAELYFRDRTRILEIVS